MEADNDEDGEEKLKPARRSRNPAKPADSKFSEAKRASDDDESDAAKYSCIWRGRKVQTYPQSMQAQGRCSGSQISRPSQENT